MAKYHTITAHSIRKLHASQAENLPKGSDQPQDIRPNFAHCSGHNQHIRACHTHERSSWRKEKGIYNSFTPSRYVAITIKFNYSEELLTLKRYYTDFNLDSSKTLGTSQAPSRPHSVPICLISLVILPLYWVIIVFFISIVLHSLCVLFGLFIWTEFQNLGRFLIWELFLVFGLIFRVWTDFMNNPKYWKIIQKKLNLMKTNQFELFGWPVGFSLTFKPI